MVEAVKRLKANKVLEGLPCPWCSKPLALGEDAAVCSSCGKAQHGSCWEEKRGCATPGCENAPLKSLETTAPQALPPGKIKCLGCGRLINANAQYCVFCKTVTSPDGIYHGPTQNAPGAVASLVWGILSLLLCGIILGPVAISRANRAQELIRSSPQYRGEGLASAGKILGIIGLILSVLMIALRLALMSRTSR